MHIRVPFESFGFFERTIYKSVTYLKRRTLTGSDLALYYICLVQ